jgi:hypothetical protein
MSGDTLHHEMRWNVEKTSCQPPHVRAWYSFQGNFKVSLITLSIGRTDGKGLGAIRTAWWQLNVMIELRLR